MITENIVLNVITFINYEDTEREMEKVSGDPLILK